MEPIRPTVTAADGTSPAGPPPGRDATTGERGIALVRQIDSIAGQLTSMSDVWLAGAPPTPAELTALTSRLEALHRSITGRSMVGL